MENKDYRVRVTKMLIRKEFTQLLKEKPVQSITVRELCERTGINRSTFYNHYQDVYDLLEQIENEMLGELNEHLKMHFSRKRSDVDEPFRWGFSAFLRETRTYASSCWGKTETSVSFSECWKWARKIA